MDDYEQPIGEYPELPPSLFYMQRILASLNQPSETSQ